MANTVRGILDIMKDAPYNPSITLGAAFNHLRDITNGQIEIVDPTNPAVFSIESAAVFVAGFLEQNEASDRKRYAYLAQTEADLYNHMSDLDYADRFALPSKASFGLVFEKNELLTRLVPDPSNNNRELIIPRNTYFELAGTQFSLQYPIIIRQLSHGGLQVVWDVSTPSPLMQLETNVINWEFRNMNGSEWLYFQIDAQQFSVRSITQPVDDTRAVQIDIPIEDQYYYARVFMEDAQGLWQEIRTTHSQQIYDVNVPTAVLKVLQGLLTVKIPQIYTTRELIQRNIRVDLYTTKGEINMNLAAYQGNEFTITWMALDKQRDETIFTAPLKNFRGVGVMSDSWTLGGRSQLGFEQLRDRVINSAAGRQELPITPAQIQSALENSGYEIVRNIDIITDRAFLATRHLPKPVNERLITAAAASIETVSTTISDALSQAKVIDNGESVTITPDVIYQSVRGIAKIVPQTVIDDILRLPPDQRALRVTNGQFYYTPFHYVLDTTEHQFDSRPYYLDSPEAEMKVFVGENDTTQLQVSTDQYLMERIPSGYRLRISTKSSKAFKDLADSDIFVQLTMIPPGERERAYLEGKLIRKDPDTQERIYEFDLSTNFNVTKKNLIEMIKFRMFDFEDRRIGVDLTQTFDILFSTSKQMESTWRPNQIDALLGRKYLPLQIAGITHEQIRLRFGSALKALWASSRSVISDQEYKRYEADVLWYYEENKYLVNPENNTTIFWENGRPTFKIEHHKGDPVMKDGVQMVKYHKGEVVKDPDGSPVIVNPRGALRQFDVMLLEGAYWFSTNVISVDYRKEMVDTLLNWILNDLGQMTGKLLENTRIFFYPKATMGEIEVMIAAGGQVTISAGQSFVVELYVNGGTYANSDLKNQLVRKTVKILSDHMRRQVVSISDAISDLRDAYGTDVINVKVEGLGGGLNLPALTVLDARNRCSVRKRLVAQPDESLIVEEDVVVNFVRHDQDAAQ